MVVEAMGVDIAAVTGVDTLVVVMAAATLHTLAGMVPVATLEVGTAAVVFLLVDMAAVSGTADGGVTALVLAGNGHTLMASTCGSAINS